MTEKSSKIIRHAVVSAAQLLPTYPILGATDVFFAGNTVDESLTTRALSTAFTFAGGGLIYDMVREGSLEYFGVERGTHATARTGLHDAAYNAAMYVTGSVPFYLISAYMHNGGPHLATLATNVGAAALLGAFSGPIIGFTTDVLKHWCGVEECARLPALIRERTPRQKKTLAGLLVAASLGTAALAYSYAPEPQQKIVLTEKSR